MNHQTVRRLIVLKIMATLSFATMAQSFDARELTSSSASWGINPTNPASINLLDAWKRFKKKKDIVVAVVDTGIDRENPYIEKNVYVQQGHVDSTNFGVDF